MNIKEKIDLIIPHGTRKKVILWGGGICGANALCLLKQFGKEVSYIVDSDLEKQKQLMFGLEVRSPYDLMYEDKDNVIILVTAAMAVVEEITKILKEMGFDYDKHYFMTLATESYAPFSYIDPVLSYSRGKGADFEKVTLINGEQKEEKVVLTLGGSTTDGTLYGINSWTYYLQQKLGGKVQCYNGGTCGVTTAQELLKLIRDGFPEIKPDIVIDYSGINDSTTCMHGFTHPYFYGIMSNLVECYSKNVGDIPDVNYGVTGEKVDRYIMNMRMMKGICTELNCEFVAILQPAMWTCKKYRTNVIEEQYLKIPSVEKLARESIDFYDKAVEEIKDYEYIYDFTKIFNEEEGCFYEGIHCNEKGNEIIANKIYELLKEKEIID